MVKFTQSFTNEQIRKLACDAHAFLEAGKLVGAERERLNASPESTAYDSLTTVLMTNLGLGLELKLKFLHVVAGQAFPHLHVLHCLFDSLPAHVKNALNGIYADVLSSFRHEGVVIGMAYTRSSQKPDPPSVPVIDCSTFGGFLEYLDAISLYGRRYSWEDYSIDEWAIELTPKFFPVLINRVTEYANELQPDL